METRLSDVIISHSFFFCFIYFHSLRRGGGRNSFIMATLRVKIFAARDLPIMDSQSHLTDAYCQIRHCDQNRKTGIVKRTLHPTWNVALSFDIADYAELQEEPLEVKVWDHDTWTADDLIGTFFIDLNVLLLTEQPSMGTWFPIFDSMRGLRGEICLAIQIKFMHGGKQANPFIPRIPECKDGYVEHEDNKDGTDITGIAAQAESVMIFAVSRLDPSIYRIEKVVGMVEELALKHDPEHARLQSLRSSRITNDQRMMQFFRISGHVRRMLAKKAIEHGSNCILGYREQYDLEPTGGNIIIRGYGSCCQISKIVHEDIREGSEQAAQVEGDVEEKDFILPDMRRRRHMRNLHQLMKEPTKLLTINSLPCNVIKRIGGIVSARSIKLITQLRTKAVVQERDSWWQEIREEVKVNAAAFNCNAVIGYNESAIFHEDVCVLSATGTAVVADWGAFQWSTQRQLKKQYAKCQSRRHSDACHIAHAPATSKLTMSTHEDEMVKCLQCKQKPVPAFLLANVEVPPELPTEDSPVLVEASFVKKKEKNSGEPLAIEISKLLPHLEYHIHKQLVYKVQGLGKNAAFGMRVDINIGTFYAIATATATAVRIPCLPVVYPESVDNIAENIPKSSILNLNYFATASRSFTGRGESIDQQQGGDGVKTGSPVHNVTSSPSDSGSDTSSTSSTGSSKSGSSGSSSTSNPKAVFIDGDKQVVSHVRPYVVDIEPEDRRRPSPLLTNNNNCLVVNVECLQAIPLNVRPSHSITIQRRFEFSRSFRLSDLFNHMHGVLLSKISNLGPCVLACYKSEVSFASDNDINIRVMGYVLTPSYSQLWFKNSLQSILKKLNWQDSNRRQLHEDLACGKVNLIRFQVSSLRAIEHERSTLNAIEIIWEDGTQQITKIDCKIEQSIYIRLHKPVVVTGYRIQTNDDEPGRDPMSWTLSGTMCSASRKRGKWVLLSGLVKDLPAERVMWVDCPINQIDSDAEIPNMKKGLRRRRTRRLYAKRVSATVEDLPRSQTMHSSPKSGPSQSSVSPRSRAIFSGLMKRAPTEGGEEDVDSHIVRCETESNLRSSSFHIDPQAAHSFDLKKKRSVRYSKPEKWQIPYLQVCALLSGDKTLSEIKLNPENNIY